LWDLVIGKCLKVLQGHGDKVMDLALSPDGNTLASASLDRTIKLWNSKTGECLRTLEGHTYWVLSIDFSPDGLTLISSSKDETIRLWDVTTGQCLKILTGKPYEGMNITGIKGLTEAEKATLKALGAIEEVGGET
jgi:WD40 repeat protein